MPVANNGKERDPQTWWWLASPGGHYIRHALQRGHHRENGGARGPLRINPIYTFALYSGYFLGISPFGVKQLQLGALHPKGTSIFQVKGQVVCFVWPFSSDWGHKFGTWSLGFVFFRVISLPIVPWDLSPFFAAIYGMFLLLTFQTWWPSKSKMMWQCLGGGFNVLIFSTPNCGRFTFWLYNMFISNKLKPPTRCVLVISVEMFYSMTFCFILDSIWWDSNSNKTSSFGY